MKVKDAGFIDIALLYFVFTVSCLATPAIVNRLGARWSVFTALTTFIAFCVVNVVAAAKPHDTYLVWVVLCAGGAVCGFGASFLWTAQGMCLDRAA